MADQTPLVLDVDGTFLKTDMLLECWWAAMGRDPMATLRVSFIHFRDRAALKSKLAQIAQIRTDLLPVNADVAALAAAARADGRTVVLASASDVSLVQPLADHHDMGGRIFASDGHVNLKGTAKADALVAAYGEGGFDYAGNDASDLAIWKHADKAIVVGDVAGVSKLGNVTQIPGGWSNRDVLRAMRPHQWVKGTSIFDCFRDDRAI